MHNCRSGGGSYNVRLLLIHHYFRRHGRHGRAPGERCVYRSETKARCVGSTYCFIANVNI